MKNSNTWKTLGMEKAVEAVKDAGKEKRLLKLWKQ